MDTQKAFDQQEVELQEYLKGIVDLQLVIDEMSGKLPTKQSTVRIRGLRGATVADANSPEAIHSATRELLLALAFVNRLDTADIASIIFTTTPDLTAEPPAIAARELGWEDVALLCVAEMPCENDLPRCIRVLIHWNTNKLQHEVRHVFLRDAAMPRAPKSQRDRVGVESQ